jgi:hypothetical protein
LGSIPLVFGDSGGIRISNEFVGRDLLPLHVAADRLMAECLLPRIRVQNGGAIPSCFTTLQDASDRLSVQSPLVP